MPANIINKHTWPRYLAPVIGGQVKRTGLQPRDWSEYPQGCFAWAEPFPDELLIPEDEIDDRIRYQEEQKASLLDLRSANYETLQSLDQDGLGLCWAFSTTKAMMYLRALMGEPALLLSAWWVAGKVKGWRDQGGWGGESLAQIVKDGVPVMSYCPGYKSSYDNEECRANAALHKCVEWWEGSQDADKALHQMATAHLLGLPTINDYNFWSHSVCGIKMDRYKGGPKNKIDNSWGEKAGDKGIFVLEGEKSKPNGLWIPRVQTPSVH